MALGNFWCKLASFIVEELASLHTLKQTLVASYIFGNILVKHCQIRAVYWQNTGTF